jgi:hypothetical protein
VVGWVKPGFMFVKLMHSEEHKRRVWEAKAKSVMLDDADERSKGSRQSQKQNYLNQGGGQVFI